MINAMWKFKRLFLFAGIFLILFSIDGFLLIDYSIPQCKGFVAMGWFIFFHLGFNPMAILSNPECLMPFYVQTILAILFGIGTLLIIRQIIGRHKQKIYSEKNQ